MRFFPAFFIGLLGTTAHAIPANVTKRAQCASTLQTATDRTNSLQSHFWSPSSGFYTDGSLWTDANTFETLMNLMLAAGTSTWQDVITTSTTLKLGGNSGTTRQQWQSYLAGSNDDSLWVVLTLFKVADFVNARGGNGAPFMQNAQIIYDIIAGQWDNVCGGGVWWSTAHTYKNAITNQLFLLTSANGYLRNRNATYMQNAVKEWNWLKNSGMRNAQGLFNDGLDSSTCKNNGQTTWTYNQGVIASGLANLFAITGDKSLLDQAEITLDATIKSLTNNNILKESCDNAAAGGAQCNHDQQIFKGIWTKHLQYYLDMANDPARTSKYSSFLGSLHSAVFHFGTSANGDIGSVWYAADQGGSVFSPESSGSGIAALVAAAKYGPC